MTTRPHVVFVDVDDTLVRSAGPRKIPIASVVERVRQLHAAGHLLYCWSSGGGDYARETATGLGLEDCFVAFLPKPEVMIDDQHPSDWRHVRWVHTNEAATFALPLMTWSVMRQDDNGIRFLVRGGLPHEDAQALCAEFESLGHKQLYWVSQRR